MRAQPRALLLVVSTAALAMPGAGCNRPDPASDCRAPVAAVWNIREGTLARGAVCGTWVAGTNGGSADDYSAGHFEHPAQVGPNVEITVRMRRLSSDTTRPVEVAFLGGTFAINARNLYYFWETREHWTSWQPMHGAGPGENLFRVEQRGADVTAYVNEQLVGRFRLNAAPAPGRVGVLFKGDPGQVSRMEFRDFSVRPLS